ncbi:zinc finger protein 446 [Sigmodon hispidus]
MNILLTPASLLLHGIHVETELRPSQETSYTGPEALRSHLPEVGAIAGPGLVQVSTSSPSESLGPCKNSSGLLPTALLEVHNRSAPWKLYTCERCGLGFNWKSVFIFHPHTHHGEPSLKRPP